MQILIIILQYVMAVIALSLIVVAHEFGHFLMAKLSGVHVEEFFIGFGPKLWKLKDKRGTTYGISAIPVGGYNKLLGMDRNENIPARMKSKAFYSKPWYKKLLISIGGIGFNLIFAVLLIIIYLSMGVMTPTSVIDTVQPDSPAEAGGFREGDRVVSLEGSSIKNWEDFSTLTKKYPGEEVTYTVIREGREKNIEVKLENIDGQGYLGISPGYEKVYLGFFGTIKEGLKITWDISVTYIKLIGMLLTGKIPLSEARPVSPVGIVSVFQQSASMGMQNFIFFIALVSILMGYGNLIPMLPLDGGHIIFIIIESLRKKPVPGKVLEIANSIGVFILVSLFIIAFVLDIINPFDIFNL